MSFLEKNESSECGVFVEMDKLEFRLAENKVLEGVSCTLRGTHHSSIYSAFEILWVYNQNSL